MLVLTLAGVGRGLAAASDTGATAFGVPGVASHICHAGDGSAPVDPSLHDCCDACALLAPLALAGDMPSVRGPAAVRHAERVRARAGVPTVARPRTPRMSQGPPTA